MELSSTAFSDGAAIPRRFTCDGEDLSPPLEWSHPPKETRGFVLLCDDPDAPGGTWHHWAAYDIPAALTALAQGAARHAEKQGFKQATNDFQRADYGGIGQPIVLLRYSVACLLSWKPFHHNPISLLGSI